ncbi:E4 [Human papillomavirus type 96]|uniref:E4 n=1 Tax=human papillomavirus 96 TaxID=247269 RepID=Q6TY25_9PAPI|nr:E4 [Human papillomavirus type 96]AAQ88292.1 E4 [Human papillomavirus type 96]
MLADLELVENGKCVLTGKLSLLLLPAPRRPHTKRSENGLSPPTSPRSEPPLTPAPYRLGDLEPKPPKGEGTDEKNLVLQLPPSGSGKKYHDLLHGKPKNDGPGVHRQGQSKPVHGDGDNGEPGPVPEPEAGAGAGAGAAAEPEAGGQGNTQNRGEGEVEGRTPQDPEVDLQSADLLTSVAFQLHKWEGQFNQLVETILRDLRDYWMKLSTPQ